LVVDIAHGHRGIEGAGIDVVSPVCNYIVRHALQDLYENRHAGSNAWL
jgi:hypothetical protein